MRRSRLHGGVVESRPSSTARDRTRAVKAAARACGAAAVRIADAEPDAVARERMRAAFARGDFATATGENLVHGSAGAESTCPDPFRAQRRSQGDALAVNRPLRSIASRAPR